MKPIVGWAVHHPFFLNCVPTRLEDLIWEAQNIHTDFDWPDLYDNQSKATQAAIEYLNEMRSQALADIVSIESWTKPVPLGNGIFKIYTFPPGFIDEQIQKSRQYLRIAEAGLTLCA